MRHAGFRRTTDKDLQHAVHLGRGDGRDVLQGCAEPVRDGVMMQEPPARQHLEQADPVIGPTGQHEHAVPDRDGLERGDILKPRAEIVYDVIDSDQGAVILEAQNAER